MTKTSQYLICHKLVLTPFGVIDCFENLIKAILNLFFRKRHIHGIRQFQGFTEPLRRMLRMLEIGLSFNTSRHKAQLDRKPRTPTSVTEAAQESRSPHGNTSQYSTVGQAEFIFTCEYQFVPHQIPNQQGCGETVTSGLFKASLL